MSNDCPEFDPDDICDIDNVCDDCLHEMYEAEINEQLAKLEAIEEFIVAACLTKPLKSHPHRTANNHLNRALVALDELYYQIRGE